MVLASKTHSKQPFDDMEDVDMIDRMSTVFTEMPSDQMFKNWVENLL